MTTHESLQPAVPEAQSEPELNTRTATEETSTAPYVTDALDRAQRAFDAMIGGDTPEDRRKYASLAYAHHVSVALLHEALAHVLPDRAWLAVRWLQGALEDDTAAQWVYEARQAIARGERVPLPFDETQTTEVSE